MAKRMIDTDLWNNEDIIEMFTAEDRYFWLYLLTNPHNSICGVMKASPVLIARDMGYSKECVNNLLYRFECIHKLINIDKETKELVIINWNKFNWTKSPKILQTIKDSMQKVNSQSIRQFLQSKIDIVFDKKEEESEEKEDTVCIGYQYHSNTNTITDTITDTIKEIVDYFNSKCDKNYKYDTASTKRLINARLNEGFTVDDFKKVIDIKSSKWLNDEKMKEYLRPETLFCASHFESYLNETTFTPQQPTNIREWWTTENEKHKWIGQWWIDGKTDEELIKRKKRFDEGGINNALYDFSKL